MRLDTSGLLCLLDRAEPLHPVACAAYEVAARRFTHGYVLAEPVALAHARRVPRAAALAFVGEPATGTEVDLVWVDGRVHRRAFDLLVARPDKSYSRCDAVSFVLMRDRGVSVALTTDRHFEQEGFVRLLAPDTSPTQGVGGRQGGQHHPGSKHAAPCDRPSLSRRRRPHVRPCQ